METDKYIKSLENVNKELIGIVNDLQNIISSYEGLVKGLSDELSVLPAPSNSLT